MILRNSESNIKQLDCECLQGGYIFRFNEVEVIKTDTNNNNTDVLSYQCQELFYKELPLIADIENLGFELSQNQVQFIISCTYQDQVINVDNEIEISLDELKQIKLNEFNPILNEFTLLISRAKLISGESQELDNVISVIKRIKDSTIAKINDYQNTNDLMRFKFLDSDITFLKNLLNPFLF